MIRDSDLDAEAALIPLRDAQRAIARAVLGLSGAATPRELRAYLVAAQVAALHAEHGLRDLVRQADGDSGP